VAKKQKSASVIKFLDGKDSKEEVYMMWYFQELKDAGILYDFVYHPETFNLIDGFYYLTHEEKPRSVKKHRYTLSGSHSYTPDYLMKWNMNCEHRNKLSKSLTKYSLHNFIVPFVHNGTRFFRQFNCTYIDVKPEFIKRSGDAYAFSLLRGLMLKEHGINVQKVVIEDLFKHTFTPARYLLTDTGRQSRKITKWKPISLETFLTK
jgi:hypothetical protein